MASDPSKTESATPHKREEARKKGQVARSGELTGALALLGMLVVLKLSAGFMLKQIGKVCVFAWGGLGNAHLSMADMPAHLVTFGGVLLLIIAPVLAGAFTLGILGNVVQFGIVFAPEALEPRWDNLSPTKGFQRIYSRRSAVEMVKGFAKILVIGLTAWFTVSGHMGGLLNLMNTNLALYLATIGSVIATLILRVALVILVMALADYFYQRWEYEESLKMSKQEIKDEHRQMEGDPLVKARIRRLQQDAARRRMFAELPKADVVITNPTHLAVAVRYDGEGMDAPVVLAKGARLMAARIKAIAAEHNIPVMENKPLARALYKYVPVGGTVPGAFFGAIAEVLAFVYQTKGTLESKALQNQQRIARKKALPA